MNTAQLNTQNPAIRRILSEIKKLVCAPKSLSGGMAVYARTPARPLLLACLVFLQPAELGAQHLTRELLKRAAIGALG